MKENIITGRGGAWGAAQGAKGDDISPKEGLGGRLTAADITALVRRDAPPWRGPGQTCTLCPREPHSTVSIEPSSGQRPPASDGPRARPVQKASLTFLSPSCPIFEELNSEEEREERRREIGVGIGSDQIILTRR